MKLSQYLCPANIKFQDKPYRVVKVIAEQYEHILSDRNVFRISNNVCE